jgi:hypothetical protein
LTRGFCWVSTLCYPNLLETKRLCCCCCCYASEKKELSLKGKTTNSIHTVHYSPSYALFTLLFLLDTIIDVQVLSLIPKEGEGESFEDALARVRRCLGGGGATDNADSDSDLEVVTESVTVNLRCPVSFVLHISIFMTSFFGFVTYMLVPFTFFNFSS